MAGKELTLDEMKAVELGILKKFDSICKENGLEYSLAYGTMLGAIRPVSYTHLTLPTNIRV